MQKTKNYKNNGNFDPFNENCGIQKNFVYFKNLIFCGQLT